MGLRRNLSIVDTVDAIQTALAAPSPWADDSHLAHITWDELYPGMAGLPTTRAEAMAVPAIARGRHMIVATIARLPLAAYRNGDRVADQPAWTYRSDGAQSPAARNAATADDLIFHGQSLWRAERDREQQVIRATHVPWDRWTVDADGYLTIDDARVPNGEAIHIPGLHEGILTFGAETIRGAINTMAAAVDVAQHPMRLELHDTGDFPLPKDEQRQLVAEAKAAMSTGSGVVYTSPGLEARLHPVDTGSMHIDGRESFAVDAARILGIPSAMVDAHSRGATMTYSTTADVIQSFLHLGLTLYLTPITARLSLDDVAPRGTEIRFDYDTVIGPAALADPAAIPATEPAAGDGPATSAPAAAPEEPAA